MGSEVWVCGRGVVWVFWGGGWFVLFFEMGGVGGCCICFLVGVGCGWDIGGGGCCVCVCVVVCVCVLCVSDLGGDWAGLCVVCCFVF